MNSLIKTSLHKVIEKPISGIRPRGGVNFDGDIPSFGGENISIKGTIDFYPVKKVTTEFFNKMKRGHLKDLDVLINKDGANTGKSAIYRNSPYKRSSVNEHIFILRGLKDHLDQVYLHYLLQFPSVRKIMETKITGSAQPGLNSSFPQNFPIELVPLSEQKKIASILTSVDEVIDNTQKKINKLQDLKKVTMNKLLTKGISHTEFKNSELGRVPKSWVETSLGGLIENIADGGTPSTNSPNFFGGEILWVVIDDIQPRIIDTEKKITELGLSRSSAKMWDKGTIILSTGATIGRVGIAMKPMATKQGICGIVPNKKLDRYYLFYFLTSINKKLNLLSQGSTIKEVRPPTIKKIKLALPPLSEQKKIASILVSIDDVIEEVGKEIDKFQFLKKSLMQDLLTGKVRVKMD